MFYTVSFFGTFAVVKTVNCTNKVTCNAADSFELYAFANQLSFWVVCHNVPPFLLFRHILLCGGADENISPVYMVFIN